MKIATVFIEKDVFLRFPMKATTVFIEDVIF